MDIFFIVIKNTVMTFLLALQLALFLRAILSIFIMEESKIMDFLYVVTEPFLYPMRALFEKMNWFVGLPIDMSFMMTYLVISLLTVILP